VVAFTILRRQIHQYGGNDQPTLLKAGLLKTDNTLVEGYLRKAGRGMQRRQDMWGVAFFFLLVVSAQGVSAGDDDRREQLVPILGVKHGLKPAGTVAYLIVSFETRSEESGLIVHFRNRPGRFSRLAQTSVDQAIRRTARSLGLRTDNWTVELSVPYPDVTIYGESLSAMIGLSVAALAQGEFISPGRAITGTVTSDGRIGAVGSVPLKIAAAQEAHFQRVLVPEERDPTDGDYPLPFLMHVTPVDSIHQAYTALVTRPDLR
jgi:hypothetical protein